MSAGKRHKVYAIWAREDDHGYKKGKAYHIYVTFHNDGTQTMIFKDDHYKEYKTIVNLLWDWDNIKIIRE